MTTVELFGVRRTGREVYRYHYPHAVTDKTGSVVRFEQRVQRIGLALDDGSVWHACSQHVRVIDVLNAGKDGAR